MADKVHLLFCENFRTEVLAVIGVGSDFKGVTASFFPARCGQPPLTRQEIAGYLPADDMPVEVVGNSCLNGLAGKGSLCGTCHLNTTTPCLTMLMEREPIERFIADGAYLLTPGWLAGWRERIARWGFSREGASAFLRESTKLLLLLDTGVDDDSPARLKELAEYLQLPYSIVPTGIDYFSRSLRIIVLNSRLELERKRAEEAASRLRQRSSDYAMAMDLLGRFTRVHDEEKVIRLILDNFNILFAPQTLCYLRYAEGSPHRVYSLDAPPRRPDSQLCQQVADLRGDYLWDEDGSGLFRIALGETFGVIVVGRITFPEYGEHYVSLAHAVLLPICALSINNARSYRRVMRAEKALNRANRELRLLAATDGLTLVANRRRHDDYLNREWRRACREKWPLSMIMIDVDHFKKYNDTYGHQQGDDCLLAVARVISGCTSRPADLVARYGGEEFSVVLPNTDSEGAFLLAEKIRTAMEATRLKHRMSPTAPRVTLSLGVSTMVPTEATSAGDLIAAADRALYRAKSQGRNRVVVEKGDR